LAAVNGLSPELAGVRVAERALARDWIGREFELGRGRDDLLTLSRHQTVIHSNVNGLLA
jgi:hypothetical protein